VVVKAEFTLSVEVSLLLIYTLMKKPISETTVSKIFLCTHLAETPVPAIRSSMIKEEICGNSRRP